MTHGAIEQHLEDMLAEELLRGTFHGFDTITVKATDEGSDKKLSFDTTKNVAESPAPAVVAGQA